MKLPAGSSFILFDFEAEIVFSTDCSVGYNLLRPFCPLPGEKLPNCLAGKPGVYRDIGWIDVHYPCNGHIKVQLRVSVPEKYRNFESLTTLREKIFSHLGIPEDETWELLAFTATGEISLEQARDRDGMTDRLY